MQLTTRLSLAVSLGMLIVFAGHAYVRVQRDIRRYERSLLENHRMLGTAVATMVEHMLETGDDELAQALVSRINEREDDIMVRWVDHEGEHLAGSRDDVDLRDGNPMSRAEHIRLAGNRPALASHLRVELEGHSPTAIQVVQSLDEEPEYIREAVARTASSTSIALGLCIAIITAFGAWFVGRPLQKLRNHARRVAAGDLDVQTDIGTKDEVGELARDMNEMTRELRHARARVRVEENARAELMAQLRHVDRLCVVGETAAAVAHDLGTPMSTVRARAQMIAGGEIPPERARQLAEAVVVEIDRMTNAIESLLQHSRRGGLERERVDLRTLVSEVVDLIAPLAELRGIHIEHVQEASLELTLDRVQMRQALTNVVMNAVEASPSGTPVRICVEVHPNTVCVFIEDMGTGMPEQVATHAFDPFFTTKGARGTGLGLAIAKGIVQEHGGHVSLKSTPGEGTRVNVELPRLDAAT